MVPGRAAQLRRCLPRPRQAGGLHRAPCLRGLGQQFGLASLLRRGARARGRAWKLPGQHEPTSQLLTGDLAVLRTRECRQANSITAPALPTLPCLIPGTRAGPEAQQLWEGTCLGPQVPTPHPAGQRCLWTLPHPALLPHRRPSFPPPLPFQIQSRQPCVLKISFFGGQQFSFF